MRCCHFELDRRLGPRLYQPLQSKQERAKGSEEVILHAVTYINALRAHVPRTSNSCSILRLGLDIKGLHVTESVIRINIAEKFPSQGVMNYNPRTFSVIETPQRLRVCRFVQPSQEQVCYEHGKKIQAHCERRWRKVGMVEDRFRKRI